MSILVLGHSKDYYKNSISCSPIPVDLWFDKPIISVDRYTNEEQVDFLFDLLKSIDIKNKKQYVGHWNWAFAKDNSYKYIIDCMGNINWHKYELEYLYQDELLRTILRVLTNNGKFFSYFGVYTKIDNKLVFEPKKLRGYQYTEFNEQLEL